MILNNKIFHLFLSLLTIFIFLYILNRFILKRNITENYLTYFIPYYDDSKTGVYKFYEDEDYNRINFKNNFLYKPLKFGYVLHNQKVSSDFILSILLAKSKIYNIKKIPYQNYDLVVKDLSKNNLDLALINVPIITYYTSHGTVADIFNNIRYIFKVYQKYLYMVVKKSKNITQLENLPLNVKIGVVSDGVVKGNIVAHDILKFLEYWLNTDYQFVEYKDNDSLLTGFLNNDFDVMFYKGYYPDQDLYQFLTYNINEDYLILPFDIPLSDVFFGSNKQYYQSYVDLNNVSSNYLPKTFANKSWNRYKPDLKMLSYDEYMVTTSSIKSDVVYELISTYYNNLDLINQSPILKYAPLSKFGLESNSNIPITYHDGAYKFFKEKGFISEIDNENCKYFVGVEECTKEVLENNGFL